MSPKQVPKAYEVKTQKGEKGNLTTIKEMQRIARIRSGHPKVRELAKNIFNYYQVPSMYYIDEAIAIGNYVKENVRYVRDATGIEQIHDPLTMIDQIIDGRAQGDCDDISLLIASLLLATGHQPYFRAVRYKKNKGSYNHIYVVVYEKNPYGGKKRIPLDAILKTKPVGFEVPHKSGKEFKAIDI